MKKIAILAHPKSQYGVLQHMAQDYADAFRAHGREIIVVPLDTIDSDQLLHILKNEKISYTFAINIFLGEEFAYIPYGIPQIHLSVDTLPHAPELLFPRSNEVSLFIDKDSASIAKAIGVEDSFFFPHGISEKTLQFFRSNPPIPFSKRPFEISFIGSFQSPKSIEILLKQKIDSKHMDIILEKTLHILSDDTFCFIQTLLDTIHELNICQSIYDEWALACLVEDYIRNLDRSNLLKTLSNHTIHIFSSPASEKEIKKSLPTTHCIFHGPVPFSKVPFICAQSIAVINSFPSLRFSPHERLFTSLASGSLLITKTHTGLENIHPGLPQILPYTTKTIQNLRIHIEEGMKKHFDNQLVLSWLTEKHSLQYRLQNTLPEIEKAILQKKSAHDENPFFHIENER